MARFNTVNKSYGLPRFVDRYGEQNNRHNLHYLVGGVESHNNFQRGETVSCWHSEQSMYL